MHLLPFHRVLGQPCVVSFHGADVMLKAANPDYAMKLRAGLSGGAADPRAIAFAGAAAGHARLSGGEDPDQSHWRAACSSSRWYAAKRPKDGEWRFLQACRLIPKKGLTTCLKRFRDFSRTNPNAELLIAGKGPLQPALEVLAAQLGHCRDVHFTGFLSQENLLKLYHSCHIFLHPSEMPADENQEGIPNSVLEAMATGMPVLATRHGGIPEAVEHGRCGVLVEERDHEALAAEMMKVTRSPNFFSEMGVLASESVAANFEQSAHISALESNYREAVEIAEEAEAAFAAVVQSWRHGFNKKKFQRNSGGRVRIPNDSRLSVKISRKSLVSAAKMHFYMRRS